MRIKRRRRRQRSRKTKEESITNRKRRKVMRRKITNRRRRRTKRKNIKKKKQEENLSMYLILTYSDKRLPQVDPHHENVVVGHEEPLCGGCRQDKQEQVDGVGEEGGHQSAPGNALAWFFQLPCKASHGYLSIYLFILPFYLLFYFIFPYSFITFLRDMWQTFTHSCPGYSHHNYLISDYRKT